jgi:hypothetical protein
MPSFYAVSGPNLAWQTSKNVDRMIWTPPTDEREDRSIAAIRLEIYENLEIYEKMRKELSFENADGKSGRFEVRNGTVTVTTSHGCTLAAEIKDSMLSPVTLARTLLFQLHEKENVTPTPEGIYQVVKRGKLQEISKKATKGSKERGQNREKGQDKG